MDFTSCERARGPSRGRSNKRKNFDCHLGGRPFTFELLWRDEDERTRWRARRGLKGLAWEWRQRLGGMEGSSACEVIFISVNHSITLMGECHEASRRLGVETPRGDVAICPHVFPGKVWLIVMIFLRVLTLLFAGYPLYQDEQERFVCNTIQPGCANVCYDLYSPISLFRFWLVQLLTLCLPYIIFVVYIIHEVSNDLCVHLNPPGHVKASLLFQIQPDSFRKEPGSKMATARGSDRCFSGAYILHLIFRTLLEGGFGAAHYYFFGFYIPRRFLCQHPPCTTQVDCYISRPTEKTVMLNFMLGMAILSLFLNVLDFISSIKRSVTEKGRKKMVVEKNYGEEQCSSSTGVASRPTDPNAPLTQDLDVEVPQAGSFRKRRNSKGSCGGPDPSSLDRSSSFPHSLGPQGCNTNGNNGYSVPQEDVPENNGSDVALCPPDSMGTPRSIRVSKRGRLKPPPPPRRDLGSCPRGPAGSAGDISAICNKRVGQFTLLEQLQTNDDRQDKRSEWV